ncbi:MAG TPA: hypothetical protein VMZ90_07005, partial [Vicinamibacterales bacterium]|nr:hypothetical protein [Vicinamibacterales bacterium]
MFILFLGLVALALWVKSLAGRLARADRRALDIEQIAKDARAKSDQVARLTARVAALEAAAQQSRPTSETTAVTSEAPPVSAPP